MKTMSFPISPTIKSKCGRRSANVMTNIKNPIRSGTYSQSMGTAASSSKPLRTSLPGGNDATLGRNNRYDNVKSNFGNLESNKFVNSTIGINSVKLKYSTRNKFNGPLKADHSIGLQSRDIQHNQHTHLQLTPLSKRKSSSLVDLKNINDLNYSLEKNDFYERTRKGFSISKDTATENTKIGGDLARKSEDIVKRLRFKMSQLAGGVSGGLHRRYGSANDISAITDRIKQINISNSQKNEDRNLQRNECQNFPPNTSYHKKYDREHTQFQRRSSLDLGLTKKPMVSRSEKEEKVIGIRRSMSFSGSKSNQNFGSGLNGLRNLGNTCFMSCIWQCLCKTKLLRDYFCNRKYNIDLNEQHAPTKGRLALAFGDLMNEMWSQDGNCINPSLLKFEVQKYARRFSGSHQQDAQEFLRYFIEGVHDDLNVVKKKPILDILDDSELSDIEKSKVHWDRYLSRERSVIQDLFVGQLKSILTCSACSHCSVTYDPIWDLSLPIPKSRTGDVKISECFEAFTQEEILDGDEKPTCESCKKRRKCTKRFLIERFPRVLVLHLNRFSGLRYRTKLDTKVDFPFELRLKRFAANSSDVTSAPIYSLYAVSNHMGGTYGGHYTAHCKHPDTNEWHVYNDSRVRAVSSSTVVSSSAYVLFYELLSDDTKVT